MRKWQGKVYYCRALAASISVERAHDCDKIVPYDTQRLLSQERGADATGTAGDQDRLLHLHSPSLFNVRSASVASSNDRKPGILPEPAASRSALQRHRCRDTPARTHAGFKECGHYVRLRTDVVRTKR